MSDLHFSAEATAEAFKVCFGRRYMFQVVADVRDMARLSAALEAALAHDKVGALAARVRELEAERDGYNELQGQWRNRAEDAEARVRELEQERQGLIERFHAECCETECKCHCDELRAALASPQRSA